MAPPYPRALGRSADAPDDSDLGKAITTRSAFTVTSDSGAGDLATRTLSEPRSFLLTSNFAP